MLTWVEQKSGYRTHTMIDAEVERGGSVIPLEPPFRNVGQVTYIKGKTTSPTDQLQILGISNEGVHLKIVDADGNDVSRLIDIVVDGHGTVLHS